MFLSTAWLLLAIVSHLEFGQYILFLFNSIRISFYYLYIKIPLETDIKYNPNFHILVAM